MCGSDAPPPPPIPNPYATAAAQTQGDVNSAIANVTMGNANERGPLGSLTYNQIGSREIKDALGNPIDVPQYERVQELSPSQQGLLNQQEQLGGDMNSLAISQVGRLNSTLNAPFSTAGLPGATNSIGSGPAMGTTFAPSGPIQRGVNLNSNAQTNLGLSTNLGLNANAPTAFGDTAGSIQYGIGPDDFSKDRDRVENALMDRLNTQFDRDRAGMDTRLANQGITQGSEAYRDENFNFGRNVTDARLGAILAGGQEQSRMFGMARDQGAFNNAAQGQDYAQQQGRGLFGQQGIAQNNAALAAEGEFGNAARTTQGQFNNSAIQQNNAALLDQGTFANTAQNQGFNQNAQTAAFGNDARQQMFANNAMGATFANTARERAMQEELAMRNQPINEISTLMNGGQVTIPQFAQFQGGNIAGSTIGQNTYASAGLANQQWNTQSQAAAADKAAIYGMGSALLGSAGRMAMPSDRRLKTNIEVIGELHGLPVYSFDYLWGEPAIGFMADEVEQVMPDAIVLNPAGYKHVDYGMILGAH